MYLDQVGRVSCPTRADDLFLSGRLMAPVDAAEHTARHWTFVKSGVRSSTFTAALAGYGQMSLRAWTGPVHHAGSGERCPGRVVLYRWEAGAA